MARLGKIAKDILAKYPDKFTTDFDHNKRALEEIATLRSKVLRNQIAGYITRYLKMSSAPEESAQKAEVPEGLEA